MKNPHLIVSFLLLLVTVTSAAADFLDAIQREPRYGSLEYLGHGTYGAAFIVDIHHVVKVSPIRDDAETLANILEATILSSLNHKAIPVPSNISVHIGIENSYLEIFLPRYEKSTSNDPQFFLGGLAPLLSYLHSLNFAHRDIKPPHILQHGEFLVLIDWGATEIFTAAPNAWPSTTIPYRSPESLDGKTEFPKENDMWSLGISTLELCRNGGRVFLGAKEEAVLQQIRQLSKVKTGTNRIETYPKKVSLWNRLLARLHGRSSRHPPAPAVDPFELLLPEGSIEFAPAAKGLWKIEPEERPSASCLCAGLGIEVPEYGGLPQTPKAIFPVESEITRTERRVLFSWLHEIKVHKNFDDKVIFEAMSITDRFLQTSRISLASFQLVGTIALYLASGFYDQSISIKEMLHFSLDNFTEAEFRMAMFELLSNAQFRLLFNHPLRAYQETVYQKLTLEERSIAITLLTILEIDKFFYAKSNREKWAMVTAVFSNRRDQENLGALRWIASAIELLDDVSIQETEGFQLLNARVMAGLNRL